jgi:hypothetical protein
MLCVIQVWKEKMPLMIEVCFYNQNKNAEMSENQVHMCAQ